MSAIRALGVDGCRMGWVAVFQQGKALDYRLCPTIDQLIGAFPDARQILIDIPIGLPWSDCRARPCEVQARAWLGPFGRAASIFSPPCRHAAHASSYREACERNHRELGKQLSIQTWNICNKIAEVDLFLRAAPGKIAVVQEAHPEVCLAALNGGRAMSEPKKTREGAAQRIALLSRYAAGVEDLVDRARSEQGRSRVQRDDVIDALACYVTASLPTRLSLHGEPLHDQCGLPMQMVYASS